MHLEKYKSMVFQFFKERKDLFFFLSFCLVPLFNILRILVRNILSEEFTSPVLFFLFLVWNTVLLFMMINYKQANSFLVSFFIALLNTKFVQSWLLFFLFFEQLIFFNLFLFFGL